MRKLFCLLVATGAACVWSAGALAQTKVTGTHVCSKPDPQHMVPAGDRADHNFAVEQLKCNHTKPMEIGGDKAKDGVATDAAEVNGNKSRFHGVYVMTMQSGDKAFLPYQGNGTSKDGKPVDSKGTFSFASGTGKLKGIKGKGTFKCTPSGDGWSCDTEGEYELPK
jgi:hypothetical protein